MAKSDEEPSEERGVQAVIRHQLAVREKKGMENEAWAKVREDSRGEVVKAEEAGRAEVKQKNGIYEESYLAPSVQVKEVSPLMIAVWAYAVMGVVFAVLGLIVLQEGASELTRGVMDEEFFRRVVPVVVIFAVAAGAFEFAYQFSKRGKAGGEVENRGLVLGGVLFVVFAVAVLVMLVLRLKGVV